MTVSTRLPGEKYFDHITPKGAKKFYGHHEVVAIKKARQCTDCYKDIPAKTKHILHIIPAPPIKGHMQAWRKPYCITCYHKKQDEVKQDLYYIAALLNNSQLNPKTIIGLNTRLGAIDILGRTVKCHHCQKEIEPNEPHLRKTLKENLNQKTVNSSIRNCKKCITKKHTQNHQKIIRALKKENRQNEAYQYFYHRQHIPAQHQEENYYHFNNDGNKKCPKKWETILNELKDHGYNLKIYAKRNDQYYIKGNLNIKQFLEKHGHESNYALEYNLSPEENRWNKHSAKITTNYNNTEPQIRILRQPPNIKDEYFKRLPSKTLKHLEEHAETIFLEIFQKYKLLNTAD